MLTLRRSFPNARWGILRTIPICPKRQGERSSGTIRRDSMDPLDSDDVLLKKSFDQLKHSPIAHLFLNALHKPPVWDRVEVALKIGIHHKGVAFSKQPLHFPKRIFA